MSANLNKKILIATELHSSSMGLFFQELGFELTDKFDENEFYAFAVDSVCPSVQTLPRVQFAKKIDEQVAHLVRGHVDTNFFKSEDGKNLLRSHFNNAQELNLIERYSSSLKTIYNIKLQDYLNLGFFVDSIIVEGYRSKFDITLLRTYLNTAINFAFKKIEFNVDESPIELAYSHDGEAFAVQIAISVESFGGKGEIKGIFDDLAHNTNYLDIAYHSQINKLVISSLLFRDPKMKSTHSYFFTEISKRAAYDGELLTSLYSGLMVKEEVSYITPVKMQDESERNKMAIAKRFALFIKNTRKKEGNTKIIERSELDIYLSHYPRQKTADEIDEEIKDLTFKVLQGDALYHGLSEYIQKISEVNLNEEILEIQRMLKAKSLEEIEEITVIKNANSLDAVPYNLKSWVQDEDEIQRISGNSDLSNEEIWEIKKLKINEKIQNEVTRLRSEGKNIVLDDIVRVTGAELKASEDEIRPVVEYIVEEAITNEIAKNKKLEEVFTLGLLTPMEVAAANGEAVAAAPVAKPEKDEEKEKLLDQNTRMKKLMEQMKRELIKIQNEKKELEAINAHQAKMGPNEKLKAALATAMAKITMKDRMLEKLKQDTEGNFKLKDKRIEELELKIEDIKAQHAQSVEARNAERVEDLTAENKLLNARLEQANKKIHTATENMENAHQGDNERYEKEIDTLKLSVTMAQTLIERMKHDKAQAEMRFAEEKAELARELDGRVQAISATLKGDSGPKAEAQILALTNEKKALEEKYKAQGIELKKAEQKLKFANSQLDSANSNSKKDNKAQVKSNEAYAKQMDLMNIRMENATAEVAEKRKELHKLKQENMQMAAKVAELEKKLALLDKKAS